MKIEFSVFPVKLPAAAWERNLGSSLLQFYRRQHYDRSGDTPEKILHDQEKSGKFFSVREN